MRKLILLVEVDENFPINEDMGTIDYLEQEFDWLNDSGIYFHYITAPFSLLLSLFPVNYLKFWLNHVLYFQPLYYMYQHIYRLLNCRL